MAQAGGTQSGNPFYYGSSRMNAALERRQVDRSLFQQHHTIPQRLATLPVVREALGPRGIHHSSNLILLPTRLDVGSTGRMCHSGPHPQYTEMVRARLATIERMNTVEQRRLAVVSLQQELRYALVHPTERGRLK